MDTTVVLNLGDPVELLVWAVETTAQEIIDRDVSQNTKTERVVYEVVGASLIRIVELIRDLQ